jgi:hypothetical protein
VCFLRNLESSFAEGLYVLLRPAKKNKRNQRNPVDAPRAPEHLQHLIMDTVPSETCPWSLSGPQFPLPTAIQQRYCYPKGRPEYSSRKGGALWTMYGADGKEDVEYRLLHVYFSAKRAINKGVSSNPENEPAHYPDGASSPPKKRAATKRDKSSPRRALPKEHQNQFMNSPAITTSSSSSLYGSPLSFHVLPPSLSLYASTNTTSSPNKSSESSAIYPTWPEQLIVTPINDILPRPQALLQSPINHNYSSDDSSRAGVQSPSPFRRPIRTPAPIINVAKSPLLRTGEYTVTLPCDSDICDTESMSSRDPFPCEVLDFPLQQEVDSFWNDPFMTLMLSPSQDAGFNSAGYFGTEQREHSFVSRLNVLQESIRGRILAAPVTEQPKLVCLMASWARKVAEDPLAATSSPAAAAAATNVGTKHDDDDDSYHPNTDNETDNEDLPFAVGI